MGLPVQIKKIPDPSIHRSNTSIARAVTRTPRHHYITPVLKLFHWLKIPERIHFKVLPLTYNSLPPSQLTYLRDRFKTQPSRSTRSFICLTLSRPPVTSHLMLSKRAISKMHHVFGMIYHLNSAPFLYLHHHYCQSQDIIFIRLLHPSPPSLSLKTKNDISSNTRTPTQLIIHIPNLNYTHLNNGTALSIPTFWKSELSLPWTTYMYVPLGQPL